VFADALETTVCVSVIRICSVREVTQTAVRDVKELPKSHECRSRLNFDLKLINQLTRSNGHV
jgi:hypothetical protein